MFTLSEENRCAVCLWKLVLLCIYFLLWLLIVRCLHDILLYRWFFPSNITVWDYLNSIIHQEKSDADDRAKSIWKGCSMWRMSCFFLQLRYLVFGAHCQWDLRGCFIHRQVKNPILKVTESITSSILWGVLMIRHNNSNQNIFDVQICNIKML